MDLNYLEEATEKVLAELGITPDEYGGFIILLLVVFATYVVGTFLYYRFSCRGLTCEKIKKVTNSSEEVSNVVGELEKIVRDLHFIDKHAHDIIQENIGRVEEGIGSIRDKIAELNGIIYTRTTFGVSGRRRIDHEDE